MLLLCLGVIFLVFSILLFLLATYVRWNYGTLEKLGIPVVSPHPFLGSQPKGYTQVAHLLDQERSLKYGPIYGAYEGRLPKVYVSDPDLVRLILVKDFEYFSDKRLWELMKYDIPVEVLDFHLGEKWRVMRSLVTPALSIGRVKQLGKLALLGFTDYLKPLRETTDARTTFDPRKYVTPFTINLTVEMFLGVRPENGERTGTDFVDVMSSIFLDSITEPPNFLQTVGYVLPFVGRLVCPGPFSTPFFPKKELDQFRIQLKVILDELKRQKHSAHDVVTVFLNMMEEVKSPENKKLGITETTAIAEIFQFFTATYEGFPTAFATTLYQLARFPEAQEKLFAEIQEVVKRTKGCPEREDIVDLPYLGACLNESFRMIPAFHRLDRVCVKDWECKERGIRITKGVVVYITLYPIHHNPDLFPNPEIFRPERFLGEEKKAQHPFAFGIWGHGPKNCPASRLSTEIMKIYLFQFLRYFRVDPTPGFRLKCYPGFGPFIRTDPLLVDISPRNSDADPLRNN